MEVKYLDRGHIGRFVLVDDDIQLAELEVVKNNDEIYIVQRTALEPCSNHNGVGAAFVNYVVDYARTHSIKLLVLCAFFKSIVDQNPSMEDVLAI